MNSLCLLLAWIAPGPQSGGLVSVVHPPENPPAPAKALLGKFLFWEEQLSADNTVACGTCHLPESGGSDPRAFEPDSVHPGFDGLFGTADDARGSKGVVALDAAARKLVFEPLFFPSPQVTPRRAQPVLDAALITANGLNEPVFWDGRADPFFVDPQTGQLVLPGLGSLESQAVVPPVAAGEMGGLGRTWDALAAKLAGVRPLALAADLPAGMADFLAAWPTYPDMFAEVFGTPDIDARRIAFAIADYERTLLSLETPLDLHLTGVQPLATHLQPGFDVFTAHCLSCHTTPLTMDGSFHDLGVRPEAQDPGRALVTGLPGDRGKFKTPHLRNVALRAPFFHDGSVQTLREVIEFYDRGGDFPNPSKEIAPLGLTPTEKLDLEVFLVEALLDPRVPAGLPPFDRPTLGSELRPPPATFGSGSPAAGGALPEMLAHVPPNLGNDTYVLGMFEAPPGSLAVFVLSTGALPGGTLLGVSFNVSFGARIGLWAAVTDANGLGSIGFGIPDDPAFAGVVVYGSWIAITPSLVALASTVGVEIALF